MRFDEATRRLAEAFRGELPGRDAQLLLAPRPRIGWSYDDNPPDARHSGGLLLLFRDAGGEARILLTVRADHLPSHPGQVSLPGGALEDGESYLDAAVREAHEEVGLEADVFEVVGSLTSLHIPVSGFTLHPFVATAEALPSLRPCDHEVERILEVPVSLFDDPKTYGVFRRRYKGHDIDVPFALVEGTRLWGATAMIVCELLWLLGIRPRVPGLDVSG